MVGKWFLMEGPIANEKVKDLFCTGVKAGTFLGWICPHDVVMHSLSECFLKLWEVMYKLQDFHCRPKALNLTVLHVICKVSQLFQPHCLFWLLCHAMPRVAFRLSVQKLCSFWSPASLAKLCQAAPAPEPSEPSDVETKEVKSAKIEKVEDGEDVRVVQDPFDGVQISGLWSADSSNGCVPGVPGNWSGSYFAKKYNVVILKVDIDKSSTTFKFWDHLADRVIWMQQVLTVCIKLERCNMKLHVSRLGLDLIKFNHFSG